MDDTQMDVKKMHVDLLIRHRLAMQAIGVVLGERHMDQNILKAHKEMVELLGLFKDEAQLSIFLDEELEVQMIAIEEARKCVCALDYSQYIPGGPQFIVDAGHANQELVALLKGAASDLKKAAAFKLQKNYRDLMRKAPK